MKRQWKKVIVKCTVSLLTESVLNLLGLDDLAAYSEFIFEREIANHSLIIHCILSVRSIYHLKLSLIFSYLGSLIVCLEGVVNLLSYALKSFSMRMCV